MNKSVLENFTPESREEVEQMLLEMEEWRKRKSEPKAAEEAQPNKSAPPIYRRKVEDKKCLVNFLAFAIATNYKASELAQWFEDYAEEADSEEDELPIDPKESARIEREIKAEEQRSAKLGLATQQTVDLPGGRVITKLNRSLNSDKELSEHRKSGCPHYRSCLDSAALRDWPAFSCINCPLFKQKP